ncbi:holin [Mycobacterium phage Lolly9]|uniref:Holin n=1 Tax=Mycobacterium phage Lolly9 TaxID=1698711 RepID=A0A0K2FNH4_9CAUD|nr:holin [Mycobacterium phage Lolly9]ALA48445.1 hypothetical protein LOLLY9_27 [Mycobacterium phage Lolly9]QOP65756.1 holin [Mycobacterium phage MiniLon]QOP66502.1 holin [Mycobacterium phage MiniMac]
MNPKIRQSIYYVGAIVPGLLGLFMLWAGLTQDDADSIQNIVSGVVSILGAGAPATAAIKVGQQRKDGTFDSVSPAEAVVNGVQAVLEAQASAAAEVDKVKTAITGAVNQIPGFGPLAAQIIQASGFDLGKSQG